MKTMSSLFFLAIVYAFCSRMTWYGRSTDVDFVLEKADSAFSGGFNCGFGKFG